MSYELAEEDVSGAESDDEPTTSTGASHRKDYVDIDRLQVVWDRFNVLMSALKALPGTEEYLSPEAFKQCAVTWAVEFRKATFDEDIIPYIHC